MALRGLGAKPRKQGAGENTFCLLGRLLVLDTKGTTTYDLDWQLQGAIYTLCIPIINSNLAMTQ